MIWEDGQQITIFQKGLKTHPKPTLKTKGNSIIFGGCWAYKSGLRILFWAPKVPFFATAFVSNVSFELYFGHSIAQQVNDMKRGKNYLIQSFDK